MTQEQRELFKKFLDSIEYYTVSEKVGTGYSVHNITFFDQETDEEICSIQTITYTNKKKTQESTYLPHGKINKEIFKKAKEISKDTFTTLDDLEKVNK